MMMGCCVLVWRDELQTGTNGIGLEIEVWADPCETVIGLGEPADPTDVPEYIPELGLFL